MASIVTCTTAAGRGQMSHGGGKKSHGKGIMRTSRLLFVKVTNKKKYS